MGLKREEKSTNSRASESSPRSGDRTSMAHPHPCARTINRKAERSKHISKFRMQATTAAVCFIRSFPTGNTKSLVPYSFMTRRTIIKPKAVAVAGLAAPENSSSISVFPMEACDIIRGEACNAKMFPEVKLATSAGSSNPRVASEEIERDYLDYNDAKTVFPGEACDDLGGEFCEAAYQNRTLLILNNICDRS
ncbi:light-regulated protein, chloroplastic [Canna indica]|uniref:Light-regulated protein, chloroplastic n=1 Tax=Canna indica TaxID=4628 RepID=A0AAQ3QAZ6_9LILI|nr:light-regulated protein, chloroplastic [Canna indica]